MRGRSLVVLLVVVALAVVGLGVWWTVTEAHDGQEKAEMDAGLASARVISATFEKVGDLRVGQLRGTAIARSKYDGIIFNSEQRTRAPFTVDYYMDLSKLTVADYRWDRDTKTMFVELPTMTIGNPNVDMRKAEIEQDGVWISAIAGRELQKLATVRLQSAAAEAGRRPRFVQQARENGRSTMESLVRAPLQAAGIGNVNVVVRYAGERNGESLDHERWDTSTPLEQILREHRDNANVSL